MSTFERYLTLWVFLCIIAGVALGHLMPGFFQIIGAAEVAKVNIPVAILVWLMIIPMLLKIDFRSLAQVATYWRGIGVTLFEYSGAPLATSLTASLCTLSSIPVVRAMEWPSVVDDDGQSLAGRDVWDPSGTRRVRTARRSTDSSTRF